MSTRCNVIIKDAHDQLIFYRHSDGYPEGVKDTLTQFLDAVKAGNIRNNVSQAAGWLIIIGAAEYNYNKEFSNPEAYGKPLGTPLNEYLPGKGLSDWKVGAYEPTTCIHGDIEFLYEIDLDAETLTGWEHNGKSKGAKVL